MCWRRHWGVRFSVGLPYSAARPLGSAPCVTQQCPSQGFSSERKPYSGGSSDLGTGSGMSPCLLLPSCVPWANDLVSLSLSFLTCEGKRLEPTSQAVLKSRLPSMCQALGHSGQAVQFELSTLFLLAPPFPLLSPRAVWSPESQGHLETGVERRPFRDL